MALGWMEAGPVYFQAFSFQGFGRNRAEDVLKFLSLQIHRALSPWTSGSHYVPAPSSGIYPGNKHTGKEKVQEFQILSNCFQGGAKIQVAPSTILL